MPPFEKSIQLMAGGDEIFNLPKWVPQWVLDVIDDIFPQLRDKEKSKPDQVKAA